MTAPWDFPGSWVHFVETVYGAWLYGDSRGFRTRRHREHVDGDYKSPPPAGTYSSLERRSRQSLKQPPVSVPPEWRSVIGGAVVQRLQDRGAFPLCLAMSRQHLHALVKVQSGARARDLMGLAKKHAAFEAKARGWQGRLWAKRGNERPVRDRDHQRNVYRYILAHEKENAWVWKWR